MEDEDSSRQSADEESAVSCRGWCNAFESVQRSECANLARVWGLRENQTAHNFVFTLRCPDFFFFFFQAPLSKHYLHRRRHRRSYTHEYRVTGKQRSLIVSVLPRIVGRMYNLICVAAAALACFSTANAFGLGAGAATAACRVSHASQVRVCV